LRKRIAGAGVAAINMPSLIEQSINRIGDVAQMSFVDAGQLTLVCTPAVQLAIGVATDIRTLTMTTSSCRRTTF